MKEQLTRPKVVKNRLTLAAMKHHRLAASTLVALLLASATLVLNEGKAFAASDAAATPKYQTVIERQDVEPVVSYLDGPASKVDLPNGLRDVATQLPSKENGVWTVPLFFGGKIRLRSYERQGAVLTLQSGAKIHLLMEPADGSWKFNDQDNISTRGDGARFGFEDFKLPDESQEILMQCGDIRSGVVRLDAAGKALWRKTYVKLQRNLPERDWGYCGHFPHQAQVWAQSALVGFGDDTIGVLVDGTLIRVSAETGMPIGPVSDVKVFDSAKVEAARVERYSRMSDVGDKSGISEAEYYKLETDFFFPHGK